MELTERDMEVLQLLSRSGVMSNEQTKKIYGNPKLYHIRRLEKMSKEGYVIRKSGYVSITQKGMQFLGVDNKLVRINSWDKPQRAEMVDLVFEMPGWEVKFGTEIKRERNLNRGSRIGAVLKKADIEYAVYQLTAESPRPETIGRLWNEINELPEKGNMQKAVIFCKTSDGMAAIAAKIKKPRVKEILLLPNSEGISILWVYHSEQFKDLLAQKFPGITPSTARKYADYQWQGNYVSILLTNDAVKRHYLHDYYNSQSHQRENKDVIIVCTNDQRTFFANLYPLAKIVSLDRSLIAKQEIVSLA